MNERRSLTTDANREDVWISLEPRIENENLQPPEIHTTNKPVPSIVFHRNECHRSRHLHKGLCLLECPKNTYPVEDEQKSVCSICHYSCESCTGGSNNECKSCHGDAILISTYNGDAQCVLKSLEWKTHSTKWFYYMSILFGLNLTLVLVTIIYLCISRIIKTRNNQNGHYDYNKLLSPDEETTKHEHQFSPSRNGCLSDSD